ncbi:MAG: DUF364 domain-containing protein [Desulfotomaculaceae bacterium]|nr:DUF364 domain-containing protein [Desulfotomaculaceae bacterium]
MWKIYDALIGGIPENLIVDDLLSGYEASYVRSGNGVGMAHFRDYQTRLPIFTKNLLGAPLREVARAVKSWNFVEASVGLAAINAYYNNPEIARANGVKFSDNRRVEDRMYDPFIMSQNEIKGKKVAVIGHFPYLENLFEPVCDLSIISWEPREGDYPFSACEYIVPECEYIFITCLSFVDKTLPRMLELAKGARRVTVVGPSTTLAPVLFEYGINELSGFIIKDNALAHRITTGAEKVKLYAAGQKVSFQKS